MWKYISGVPKVVEEKKKEKNPKAACDSKGSKEYEKNRSRKFSAKWQVGRPWLQHDQHKGMICKWCIENKATFMAQSVFNSARFIDGCTSYKAESIAYHEKSADYSSELHTLYLKTFGRVKTYPGECILRVTRPNGECSHN